MKTKLSIILLLASLTTNAQLYINEIFVSPPGTDLPNEFIEIRGVAGSTIAAGTYIVQIEGDGESNPGDVEADIIDLSGLVIGSNGYLVILDAAHPYTVDPDATIALGLTDGNLEDHSHTFFLIQSATAPTSSIDIDADDDGTPDGTDYASWTIMDSISFADDDGVGSPEFAYADLIFAESAIIPTLMHPIGALVISTTTQFDYAARIGESTGSIVTNDATTSDWVAGDIPSGNVPDWVFSSNSTRVIPDTFVGSELNHIGSINPTSNTTLSNTDVLISKFSVYPNPANSVINISVIQDASYQILNINGQLLKEGNLIQGDNRLNINSFSKGMYFLRLTTEEGITVGRKLIIK